MVVVERLNLAERFQLGFEKFGSWTATKGSRPETTVDRTVPTGALQSKYGNGVWGGGYEGTQCIYTTTSVGSAGGNLPAKFHCAEGD